MKPRARDRHGFRQVADFAPRAAVSHSPRVAGEGGGVIHSGPTNATRDPMHPQDDTPPPPGTERSVRYWSAEMGAHLFGHAVATDVAFDWRTGRTTLVVLVRVTKCAQEWVPAVLVEDAPEWGCA